MAASCPLTCSSGPASAASLTLSRSSTVVSLDVLSTPSTWTPEVVTAERFHVQSSFWRRFLHSTTVPSSPQDIGGTETAAPSPSANPSSGLP